jgi:ribosomal protein L24E
MFSRKCTLCGARIEKGEGLQEEVEVYGLVDKHKRDFCSEACLEKHKKITAARMATRRPGVCMRCLK